MIPVQLQLENFMSYRKGVPPLQFTGIHLACLSGDNGNGKSALLDAITWALFGKTRAAREDDLIHLGAEGCQVIFDFDVGAGRYRAYRRRDRRGGSVWTLQAFQDDGTMRPLAEGRETRERIGQLLRLDFDTFLATAYLAQGRADVFARATPGDRKEVLARILDLSRYDRLEEKARERLRLARADKDDAERALAEIDRELVERDALQARLGEAQADILLARERQEKLQETRDELLGRSQALETTVERARDLEEKIQDAEARIAEARQENARATKRLADARAFQARRPEVEAAQAAADALEQRIATLQARTAEALPLHREKEALQATVRDAREALDRERYRLSHEIAERERAIADIARYDDEIAHQEAEIAAFGDSEARRCAAEDERARIDDALQEVRSQHAALQAESQRLAARIDALAGSESSECDYCGQPLSPTARARARADAETARTAIEAQIVERKAQGRELRHQSENARRAADEALAQLRQVGVLQNRQAQAYQQRTQLAGRIDDLPELRRQHDALAQRLATNDFAAAEQERLMALSAQLERAERTGKELERLLKERTNYENVARDLFELTRADEVAATEPPGIAERQVRIDRLSAQREKAVAQVADLRSRAAELPALRQALAETERALQAEQSDRLAREGQIGALRGQLQRLEARQAEQSAWTEKARTAQRDALLYSELAVAFGRRGVQAHIIENVALPEIQEEANRLLESMTGGAMRVQLLTQREAKSKAANPIETLDILIFDDMGQRPYEMFSGGEAFRVNLALRVALSKLLARRAGAPLQTLILDEGFGTQDPRGREAIAEALHAIADDFALVLAITHIEELKDQFPTRIEVTKGENGSTFTVH